MAATADEPAFAPSTQPTSGERKLIEVALNTPWIGRAGPRRRPPSVASRIVRLAGRPASGVNDTYIAESAPGAHVGPGSVPPVGACTARGPASALIPRLP